MGKDGKSMRSAGLAATIGLVMVAATVIGYAIGHWLDQKFGTYPILTLVFLLLGIVAGFIQMIRIVSQLD